MTPSEDAIETVIAPGNAAQVAPSPTHPASSEDEHQAMPNGTRLAEFEITRLIGVGGFGIVYLAHDASLGRDVALKEYMPSSLAFRKDGITVVAKSGGCSEAFFAGLRSFINEARMLALFDHPALVKVYRFWEANGTAYMVMQNCEGQTLKHALAKMETPPSEQWLLDLLNPLMDGLQVIHNKHCFHRDISPDNIFLLNTGQPVLLDFGAARQVIGNMVNNLTVILKPGYAPIEQYAGDPNMPQGAWTDIYALGAVLHHAILGKAPVVSVGRLIKDTLVPLEQAAKGRYSAGFLCSIDQMLGVRQDQRPQSIAELKELIRLNTAKSEPKKEAGQSGKAGSNVATGQASRSAEDSQNWPDRTKKPTAVFLAGGAVVLLAIGLGTFFFINRAHSPEVLTATGQPEPAIAPSLATSVPQVLPEAPKATVAATASAPETNQVVDPGLLLDQVYQLREPDHVVTVGLDKSRLVIGKDKFRFHVESTQGGYVYVLMLNTNNGLNLLFPNALDKSNKIKANQKLSLPRPNWEMSFEGPAGTDRFVVLVSAQARDFRKAGLVTGGAFGEFPLDVVQQLAKAANRNLLAGEPVCPVTSNCSNSYGAAQFSIEEVN
ncbi:MAG: protein kinase domain-containing protein [Rhodoferax sp.]